MSGPQPPAVPLSPALRALLEQAARRQAGPHALVVRSQLLLTLANGANTEQTARHLHLSRITVRLWRGRWLAAQPRLDALVSDGSDGQALRTAVAAVLADAPRPGAPTRFTPEQICQMVALACELPSSSGRPISQWSQRELAAEFITRGIVVQISPRQAGRFLKGGRPQAAPHPLLAHPSAGPAAG